MGSEDASVSESVGGVSSHASLDVQKRRIKAQKIATLLERIVSLDGATILDIGTGAGVTAWYLSTRVGPNGSVIAADVLDQRQVKQGFDFVQLENVQLPFPDRRFDIVISNHVIEHVGDVHAQIEHLREIKRVLRPKGVCYLAVPNRWRLTEPHYRLPMLSWLPTRWRSTYVRLARRGPNYDCNPPSLRTLRRLLGQSGLRWQDITVDALRLSVAVEGFPAMVGRMVDRAPDLAFKTMYPVMPTFVHVLTNNRSIRAGAASDV